MERIGPSAHRIAGLGVALSLSPDATDKPVTPAVAGPSAAELAAQAEREGRSVLEEAKKQGYEKGMASAQEELAQQVREVEQRIERQHQAAADRIAQQHEQLEALLKALPAALAKQEANLADAAAALAFECVTRCLGERHAQHPLIATMVEEVLRERRSQPATLFVSPKDRPSLEAMVLGDEVRLATDTALGSSAIRLESLSGHYETGVAQRIRSLADALIQAIEEPAA